MINPCTSFHILSSSVPSNLILNIDANPKSILFRNSLPLISLALPLSLEDRIVSFELLYGIFFGLLGLFAESFLVH